MSWFLGVGWRTTSPQILPGLVHVISALRPRGDLRLASASALIAAFLFAGCAARPLVAMKSHDVCAAERWGDRSVQKITVDADKVERLGKDRHLIFVGNAIVRHNSFVQYAERIELYLDDKGDRILRMVSTGNACIVTRDCRAGTAEHAEFDDIEQRISLTGNARSWQNDTVVAGDRIVIYILGDHSVVRGGSRVEGEARGSLPAGCTE